jgi:hypothetical protein
MAHCCHSEFPTWIDILPSLVGGHARTANAGAVVVQDTLDLADMVVPAMRSDLKKQRCSGKTDLARHPAREAVPRDPGHPFIRVTHEPLSRAGAASRLIAGIGGYVAPPAHPVTIGVSAL